MIIVDVQQGTPEWDALRAQHDTASEAPGMMGCSANVKRSELLRMKATGDVKEFSAWVREVLFERGHEIEDLARPIAEKIVGKTLYPLVGLSDDRALLASFDGITMLEDCGAEIKQWNETKAAHVRANATVPPEDLWQVVQQLAVSGAARWLYMVTDGTEERTVYCWIERDEELIAQLRAGWAQFNKDRAAYTPPAPEVIVEGRAPESLPALHIEISGAVMASNLGLFKERAIEVFRGIKTDLQTDQDFADADKTVKWCGEIEDKLKAAKEHALSQTASIDALFKAIDDISAEARAKRLELNRLVEARKKELRDSILIGAKNALRDHVDQINKSLGKIRMPEVTADFAGAIKGKKTLASLRDAADTELARAKIEADRTANVIRANLELLREEGQGFESLFMDAQQLVTQKSEDDLRNLVKARIAEHRQAAEARLQAERDRIRREEEARAQRDAENKAEQERARIREEERQRAAEEAAIQRGESREVFEADRKGQTGQDLALSRAANTEPPAACAAAVPPPAAGAAPMPAESSGQRIKLGDINAAIAPLKIDAAGLAALGFQPVGTEGAAKLYANLPRIVSALINHLQAVAANHGRRAA